VNRPTKPRDGAAGAPIGRTTDAGAHNLPDAAADEAPVVEIVAAGNEVLLGDVLDTNSNWLCRRVTALGGRVRRCALVRDELQAIANELRAARERRPRLLLTVGGLGPPDDDLTLSGVALATDRRLELNAEAERLVREKYEEFFRSGHVPTPEMNEARRKMARLPRGSEPLVNPVGGAPGVWLEVKDCVVVSLPGVPEELRAIVSQSLSDRLASLFGPAHYAERSLIVPGLQDESVITDILRRADAGPGVYVKSRARPFGEARALRITVSARAIEAATVHDRLSATLQELVTDITAAGFAVVVEDEAETTDEAAGS
jgi:nicotinamide-nucleotide amidase